MEDNKRIADITKRVMRTKKYRPLATETIRHIAACAIKRHGPKRAEKETKNLLHQTYGAFFPRRPEFAKLAERFFEMLYAGTSAKEAALPILALHASTRERIPFLNEFYRRIFAVTGAPHSIIDHACGLNPLTLPWMEDLPANAEYTGYDIDIEEAAGVNTMLATMGMVKYARAKIGDVLIDTFPRADVILFLKILPLLEHIEKGSGLETLRRAECTYAVVSFSTRTLSGGKKGMERFYADWFPRLIADEGWTYETITFPNELVFVVKK